MTSYNQEDSHKQENSCGQENSYEIAGFSENTATELSSQASSKMVRNAGKFRSLPLFRAYWA